MNIIELKERPEITSNKRLSYTYSALETLLTELRTKTLPEGITEQINQDVEILNASTETEKGLNKLLNSKHTEILALVKKELNLIPKNHYFYLWMVLGMAVFGLPIGVIYGSIVGNMGLLSLGLPIGFGIGMMVGMWMDNNVKKEGRQLNIENAPVKP